MTPRIVTDSESDGTLLRVVAYVNRMELASAELGDKQAAQENVDKVGRVAQDELGSNGT